MIAQFNPKIQSYSRSESADYHVGLGILHFNEGAEGSLTKINQNLNLPLEDYTQGFAKKRDKERSRKAMYSQLRTTKLQRHV